MSNKLRKLVSILLIITLLLPTSAFATDLPLPPVEDKSESVYVGYMLNSPVMQAAELAAMFDIIYKEPFSHRGTENTGKTKDIGITSFLCVLCATVSQCSCVST